MQRLASILTVLCSLLFAGTARAQETVLSGTVVDATEAALPGVTLTALHVDSGNMFLGVTDNAGVYRIGALRTGVYKLTVELPGFTTATQENLELLIGQRAVVNFKLTVSTVEESVTVTGEAPLIDTSKSKLGGNIDPRQMQQLPVNGRNWLDLSMLAPGSRANAIGDQPGGSGSQASSSFTGLQYQLNVDGQQVTSMITAAGFAQPQFARDSIAEFQLIANRFDATQGRSAGLQINMVTKSGTNQFIGSAFSYFRDDHFNAKDFIVNRVLPYSNQQMGGTFGGPITKDKVQFFAHYEFEREPRTYTFTSPYPRFNNAVDFNAVNTTDKFGGRVDIQFNPPTRLMVRATGFDQSLPYGGGLGTGGATSHPSGATDARRRSRQVFGTLTQVMGPSVVNEIKAGYNFVRQGQDAQPGVDNIVIALRGYNIGERNGTSRISQHLSSVRDDLTFVLTGGGRHEFKVGGEAMYQLVAMTPYSLDQQILDATGGPVPSNIQDLFPVWNDSSTWNLAPLSPISLTFFRSFGSYDVRNPRTVGAAWLQDDWAVTPRLTVNLGLRYDVSIGSLAERLTIPILLPEPRPSDLLNVQPRLGFAYTLPDTKTVIRGGWGKYFSEISDAGTWATHLNSTTTSVALYNDGRPDFASNPFNGPLPTYEEALRIPFPTYMHWVASANLHTPYSWQSSVGVQRQLGQTMVVTADYVSTASRREVYSRPENLTYNPATGGSNPFSDISSRLYPGLGQVVRLYSDGWSDYHALQTSFTKRFSQRWQASATYTLSRHKDALGVPTGDLLRCAVSGVVSPCPAGFTVAPDVGGDYTLAAGNQRHRAVANGIWQAPARFQLSGLYFFGSGERFATDYGADLRNRGVVRGFGGGTGAVSRLRPDGTIMPRNNLVGQPLHRVDLRVQRQIPIGGHVKLDGIFEVFNAFNHANYGSYVAVEASPAYGQPQQSTNAAYQPRMFQLGFRLSF